MVQYKLAPLDAEDRLAPGVMPEMSTYGLGWYNVADYGMLPTATAAQNDTAWAACVTAAAVKKARIYIPPGVYSKNLSMDVNPNNTVGGAKDYVMVTGGGRGGTKINQIAGTAADGLLARNVRYLTVEDLTLNGPGAAIGTGTGLNHMSNVTPAPGYGLFYSSFNRVELTNWGADGVHSNYPIVSEWSMVNAEFVGGHAFNIEPTATNDYGTSLTMTGCWGRRAAKSGYHIDKMNYIQLNGCATDACGLGYDLVRVQGGSLSGCGTETHRPNPAMGARYNGAGMRIDACMAINVATFSSWDVRGPLIYVTGNSTRIYVNGAFDGHPSTEAGSPITYAHPSIRIDPGSRVELRLAYSAGLKPANVYSTHTAVWGDAGGPGPEGQTSLSNQDFTIATAGKGLRLKEGVNCKAGTATLGAGGTVTIPNTSVTVNSRIDAFIQSPGGTPGALYKSAVVPGTSFTIKSTSTTDTSFFSWKIIEPA